MKVTVKFSLKGLASFTQRQVDYTSEAVKKTLKQWGFIYRSFARKRFNIFSKGGGDWPPLKPATIRARRGGKKKNPNVAILRDTGTLFNALQPVFTNMPGAFEQTYKFSVEVGYGGPEGHPPDGAVRISDIAAFHNFGMGHNPKRVIIPKPPPDVLRKMAQIAETNLNKEAKDKTQGAGGESI